MFLTENETNNTIIMENGLPIIELDKGRIEPNQGKTLG